MSAHSNAGVQDLYARVLVCEADRCATVHSQQFADLRKFVGECNVDVPVRVLHQLRELRRDIVGSVERSFHERFVHLGCSLRRCVVHSADQAIVFDNLTEDVTRKNTFRTVREQTS